MKKTYFLLLSIALLLLLVENANAQLKLGDQPTSVQKSVILDLQGSNGRQGVWLPRISDTTDATGIDALNPPDGVLIYHTPSSQVMIRKNGFWSSLQPTTKVGATTSSNSVIEFQLGTAPGATKDLNLSLNAGTGVITLNVPDATVDTRGIVSIGAQTFGGVKTFNDGLTSLSTTTVSGAASNASNLYLGVTSATSPGTTTDRFLSVDNSGRVILSSAIPTSRTLTINGSSYDLSANRTWNVGTVTSLAGGYGLSGGTITSSGTLAVDTNSVSTRAWRQKGIDSVAALISGGYVPTTRTLNGLPLSSNQTFATGTAGTDFGISSSGTTHTFNLPTASASNRGLLSSADWTTFNNKVSTTRTLTINGTSYDLSANRTWSVGTVTSVANGYGLSGGTITSSGTLAVDTNSVSTRAWRQKGIDSVAGLLGSYIPTARTLTINGTSYDLSANRTWSVGTVTSVANGYGLSGGTITSTGTLAVDTNSVSTRAWRQKGIDSVAALIAAAVPNTRTLNGLALSSNQTFATGTAGTDFGISSSGTTHTFNLPTASATNRGLLSSADWTTFNNKVSTTRTLTINGTSYDLSANRSWSVGTVTSVANGYGLSGGTITSTGTLAVDTNSVSTRAWRQKGIDSVAALIAAAVPTTRTLNGLALSSNQTFATGTSGTDFNISSTGTTHTFNIPDASAANRGVVTTGSQTLAGLKTFSTGATISGATSNASNLTLGITSATTPGTSTDRYLTVDGTGKVILSSVGGVTSVGAIGATPNANAASITSGVLNLQPASATFGGVVTTGTQTMAGAKTFSTSLAVSGATSNASNLTLGITSATTPGSSTDRYLSVDATGKVILSSIGVINSLGAIGASPNANGATLSSGVLTLQPASATFGGVVTTGTQTFDGTKTFQDVMSAKVNLQAGTATAGTAPLKFTSGTNLTTPENGAMEYDGTNYYATSGGVRYTLAKTLTATATLDFPATGAGGGVSTRTVTVTGAVAGDVVMLGVPGSAMEDGCIYSAYVSAANTVTIVCTNSNTIFAGSADPGSGTFRVSVIRY